MNINGRSITADARTAANIIQHSPDINGQKVTLVMEWSNNCPQCNTELFYGHNESTLTWTCPQCGWALASTYVSPIKQDTSDYEILLSKNLSPRTNQLRTLSHILGMNFIQVKKLLESDCSLLFKGKATNVLPIKNQLEQEEIEFQIIPRFNY